MRKQIIALLLVLAMVLSVAPITGLAASDEAIQAANALYELGLFQGTGANADGTPNFDLDRTPTRHEAVTMLVRLLGKEDEAKAGTWETPFTDVDDWAKPYVGYAYANGLTTGTSETTFGGANTIDAPQYLTFVLRALGYTSGTDFQWDDPWNLSDQIGLTSGNYNANTASFTRGDVAIISSSALNSKKKDTEVGLRITLLEEQTSNMTEEALQELKNAGASVLLRNKLIIQLAKLSTEAPTTAKGIEVANQAYNHITSLENDVSQIIQACGDYSNTQKVKVWAETIQEALALIPEPNNLWSFEDVARYYYYVATVLEHELWGAFQSELTNLA